MFLIIIDIALILYKKIFIKSIKILPTPVLIFSIFPGDVGRKPGRDAFGILGFLCF